MTSKDLIPLKRLIIERTEGNPFFMEEIIPGTPRRVRWCVTAQ